MCFQASITFTVISKWFALRNKIENSVIKKCKTTKLYTYISTRTELHKHFLLNILHT